MTGSGGNVTCVGKMKLLHLFILSVKMASNCLPCNCISYSIAGTGCDVRMCENGGVCTEANVCDCNSTGFTGSQCQIRKAHDNGDRKRCRLKNRAIGGAEF